MNPGRPSILGCRSPKNAARDIMILYTEGCTVHGGNERNLVARGGSVIFARPAALDSHAGPAPGAVIPRGAGRLRSGRGFPFRFHRGRGDSVGSLPHREHVRNAFNVLVPGGGALPVYPVAL